MEENYVVMNVILIDVFPVGLFNQAMKQTIAQKRKKLTISVHSERLLYFQRARGSVVQRIPIKEEILRIPAY